MISPNEREVKCNITRFSACTVLLLLGLRAVMARCPEEDSNSSDLRGKLS